MARRSQFEKSGMRRSIADQALDRRNQKLPVNRLGEKLGRAEGHGFGTSARIVVTADHHDRGAAPDPPQVALYVEAIHSFHVEIENNAVGLKEMECFQEIGTRAVCRGVECEGAQ